MAALALSKGSTEKTNTIYETTVKKTFKVGANGQLPQFGTVVSLSNDGTINSGAGITTYLNSGVYPNFTGVVQGLQVESVHIQNQTKGDLIFLAYSTSNGESYGMFGQLNNVTGAVVKWYSQSLLNGLGKVTDMVIVSSNVVFIVDSDAKLFMGTVNLTNDGPVLIVKLITNVDEDVQDGRCQIIELSSFPDNASIAVVYQKREELKVPTMSTNTRSYFLETSTFTLKPSSVVFIRNHTITEVKTALKLTSNTYAIFFSNLHTVDSYIAKFINNEVSVSPSTSLLNSNPKYHLSAVNIKDKCGILLYVNSLENNQLRAVYVVYSTTADVIVFGSRIPISDYYFGSYYNETRAANAIVMQGINENQFSITYIEASTVAKLTTVVMELDYDSGKMHKLSPNFEFSSPIPEATTKLWLADMCKIIVDNRESYYIVDYLVTADAQTVLRANNTVVEILPPPLGIVSPETECTYTSCEVIVEGIVEFNDPFQFANKTGKYYYTDSRGILVESDSSFLHRSGEYVTAPAQTELISAQSLVGISVSDNQLLLRFLG
eukprot:CAMPEP_0174273824 /NCGR_PEP_ID=MMETSP0439-20130205/55912_1 /TAXON_ID=0 /ORGANISM="Stereomyxa ramosa, Strain Chinc5" /LENGTH=548 /DNA_ID=CAMNT_0015365235 /DNA_START=117 /DNA_END=1763 /DNA_ORIENTATION=-